MNIKLTFFAFLFFLISCNSADKKTNSVNTETITNSGDNQSSGDVEVQKKMLNDQSRACIALMNSLEEDKNAATAAGNADAANAIQARIDSAATENAKIGQQLMSLEK